MMFLFLVRDLRLLVADRRLRLDLFARLMARLVPNRILLCVLLVMTERAVNILRELLFLMGNSGLLGRRRLWCFVLVLTGHARHVHAKVREPFGQPLLKDSGGRVLHNDLVLDQFALAVGLVWMLDDVQSSVYLW